MEEELAPACLGNERGDDNLCASATLSCPSPEQTRYWIWHRVTRLVVAPPSETVGSWVQEPGSLCLGPDDPGLPTVGRVIAQIRADFQRLPLPQFTIRTDPSPRTLVNVPTVFSAGSAEPVTFTPTILGARVTITARPSQWDWTFGDGATLTTTRPGTPQRPDVTHQYTRTGEVDQLRPGHLDRVLHGRRLSGGAPDRRAGLRPGNTDPGRHPRSSDRTRQPLSDNRRRHTDASRLLLLIRPLPHPSGPRLTPVPPMIFVLSGVGTLTHSQHEVDHRERGGLAAADLIAHIVIHFVALARLRERGTPGSAITMCAERSAGRDVGCPP